MRGLALRLALCGSCAAGLVTGCRDLSRFSSKGGRFEGVVVVGNFVRSGVGADVKICVTLDTDRLQDAPGTVRTSDGRFGGTKLRPIPQIWHDPLSTLSFGDGRVQNLLYVAAPESEPQDVLVVLSLMQSDHIEVRLVRGAPQTDAGPPPEGASPALFGVFDLARQEGPCSF